MMRDSSSAVVISEINVSLQAAFDAAAGSRTPMPAVRAGQAPAKLPVVDPVVLETNFDALPHAQLALSIAARRGQNVALSLDLP